MKKFRQQGVKITLCLIVFLWQAQLSWAESPKRADRISIEWQVAKDQVDDVKKVMPVKEAQTYDTRNPLLIGAVVLVGFAVLPQIAQAILDVYYRYKSGGVIFDTTKDPVLISTSDRIAPGFALVISKTGSQMIEVGGVKPMKVGDLAVILKAAMK